MPVFDQLRLQPSQIVDMSPVSKTEIDELRKSEPGLPEDYLQFLEQIGYGCLESLWIYSGPISPLDMYSQSRANLSTIILVGDDMQGYHFGFDKSRRFVLVEVDPLGDPDDIDEPDFLAFVAAHLRNQE